MFSAQDRQVEEKNERTTNFLAALTLETKNNFVVSNF